MASGKYSEKPRKLFWLVRSLGEWEWKRYIQVYRSNFFFVVGQEQVDQWLTSWSDFVKWLRAPFFQKHSDQKIILRLILELVFWGYLITSFLSWFGARLSKCLDHFLSSTNLKGKHNLKILWSILSLISTFHVLSFVFRGFVSVVNRPTRPTRARWLSV